MGAAAGMPLSIGDFPFSFIVGTLSVSAGMSAWQTHGMVRHCGTTN
jgi:predicted branched-subunit amino acid permease